jgi:hypothetical protein
VYGSACPLPTAQWLVTMQTHAYSNSTLHVCGSSLPSAACTAVVPPGCQYLTAKQPAAQQLLEELQLEGVIARWGQGGRLGDINVAAGAEELDLGSFQPYPGYSICPAALARSFPLATDANCVCCDGGLSSSSRNAPGAAEYVYSKFLVHHRSPQQQW